MISSHAIYSALLAGALALLELFNASRKPPAIRACGWILVLFGFDAGSALVIFALLKALFSGLSWFTGAWPIILAGLSGPALLRSQLALLGSGQESTYYGPANRYRRVQRGIERKIDQLGAAAQSGWISRKMVFIQEVNMSDFRFRVETFLDSLGESFDEEREHMLEYVNETLSGSDVDDYVKRRAVAQRLLTSGFRDCVKELIRAGKTAIRTKREPRHVFQLRIGRRRRSGQQDEAVTPPAAGSSICQCGHPRSGHENEGIVVRTCQVCSCGYFRAFSP